MKVAELINMQERTKRDSLIYGVVIEAWIEHECSQDILKQGARSSWKT